MKGIVRPYVTTRIGPKMILMKGTRTGSKHASFDPYVTVGRHMVNSELGAKIALCLIDQNPSFRDSRRVASWGSCARGGWVS